MSVYIGKNVIQTIRMETGRYEILREFEESLQYSRSSILAFASVFATMSYTFGLGPKFFTDVIGTIPPIIGTIKVIADQSNKFDLSHWLLYWVTFGLLVVLESMGTNYLLEAFPFYFAFKFGFLLWCQSTRMRGSMFMYNHVLAPFLKSHECLAPSPA